jgi:hypothetical protein
MSETVEAVKTLASLCGRPLPRDSSQYEDFLGEIRNWKVAWNSEEQEAKLNLLLQQRKSVLVWIASTLGLKRSGTKAVLAESIVSHLCASRPSATCRGTIVSPVHHNNNNTVTSSSNSKSNKMHSLPSIRVVFGEVFYFDIKTESTGIIFGEVERRIMNHPFTEIENQFMRILGPPFNDGKGIAWFSTTALEIGAKSVPIYFTVPSSWKTASIVLRCLRVDLSLPLHMWKNEWPFPVIAQVNGYSMKLKTATRYTNGKIFGVDGATDISEYVRRDNNSSNKVVIFRPSTSSDASSNNVKVEYLFFAQPAYIYTDGDIFNSISSNSWSRFLQRIRQMGNVPFAEVTSASHLEWFRLYILNYMAAEDLQLEHFQILLRCPLSLTPLKWPALSISCKHLQCFDLLSFLSFTRNNLRFLCPICSIQVCWDELLICPFTLEILSHYPDAKALNIYSDGSFQIVREEIEQDCTTTSATTPRNKNTSNHHPCHVEQPQIIDLSDDDDDE